ncbi:MAG: cupin domain-containing protein [Hyphomicrobiaceae bacterium]
MSRGSKVFSATDVPESNATGYPAPHREANMKRHARRIGDFAGLKNFGVNLVRVEPGGQSSARHAHARQDEIVHIVDGPITLETDAGREVLATGAWVGFPAGTGDAHRFINTGDRDATFLVIGDRSAPEDVVYPDIDMHATADANGVWRYTRKDGSEL